MGEKVVLKHLYNRYTKVYHTKGVYGSYFVYNVEKVGVELVKFYQFGKEEIIFFANNGAGYISLDKASRICNEHQAGLKKKLEAQNGLVIMIKDFLTKKEEK
jgi:hypothetical protein